MDARIVILIEAIFIPLVPFVLALHHLGRVHEWDRLEREKATEKGFLLPEHTLPDFPARLSLVCIATGAVMPFGIVYLAWLARLVVSPVYPTEIVTFAVMSIGVTGAFFTPVCYALAIFGRRGIGKKSGGGA